jgi:NADH:ubiquinone oxidoreductase subunit F (NADH-binding)
MTREARPLAQITAEAMRILYREIGIVDTLRFINQYTAGDGDYTAQREELFAGMTLDNIVSEIKRSRKRGRPKHDRKPRHKKTTAGKRIRKPQTGRQKSA